MNSSLDDYESTRKELAKLIGRHKRARVWFRRTGISSLVAAGLWIIMYNLTTDSITPRETLAVMLGAALMWILFIWAFFLLRKLNLITADIRRLERKMVEFAAFTSNSPENVEQS